MIAGVERGGGGGGGDCSHVSLFRAGRCVKQAAMAMSLSAEDEDYDSDSEQVSAAEPCRHHRNARARHSGVQHHRTARKLSYLERNALSAAVASDLTAVLRLCMRVCRGACVRACALCLCVFAR